ncbi:hypothetical protein LTR36_006263, partial [Oleoguttula mirabilis]
TDANAIASPLLRPPELRNRIWSYSLAKKTIHVHGGPPQRFRNYVCVADTTDYEDARQMKREPETSPAMVARDYLTRYLECHRTRCRFFFDILQVSREIHQEAALLPYLDNTFAFASLQTLMSFLKKLVPAQARAIRTITLVDPEGVLPGLPQLVHSRLTGLKRLTCFIESGVRGWWTARGAARRQVVAASIFQLERTALVEVAVVARIAHEEARGPGNLRQLADAWAREIEERLVGTWEEKLKRVEARKEEGARAEAELRTLQRVRRGLRPMKRVV